MEFKYYYGIYPIGICIDAVSENFSIAVYELTYAKWAHCRACFDTLERQAEFIKEVPIKFLKLRGIPLWTSKVNL